MTPSQQVREAIFWPGGDGTAVDEHGQRWGARFDVPPVSTALWRPADWARWVGDRGFYRIGEPKGETT